MTFPRNAPIEQDLIFLSKAVDVESQCITFASLPHLCVFGVECREIASAKFLADQNDIDEMAMTFEVGGRKSGFGRETFIKAMTESGIGEKVAAKIISKLCAFESEWCEAIDSSFLSDNLKKEYKSLIHSRLVQLI